MSKQEKVDPVIPSLSSSSLSDSFRGDSSNGTGAYRPNWSAMLRMGDLNTTVLRRSRDKQISRREQLQSTLYRKRKDVCNSIMKHKEEYEKLRMKLEDAKEEKKKVDLLCTMIEERQRGHYRVLKGEERKEIRDFYKTTEAPNLPFNPFFQNQMKTSYNIFVDTDLFATTYERLILSDHGSFLEIDPSHLTQNAKDAISAMEKTEKPATDGPYAKYSMWGVHILKQLKTVKYGDFQPGNYYISPLDVTVKALLTEQ
jgi:hypothetical protein